ncbi:hypothetical protein ACFLV1_01140 [Chloroflexota bacterium]
MPEKVTLEVLNPRTEIEGLEQIRPRSELVDLNGKKIGLVDNTKPDTHTLLVYIAELLKDRFPDIKTKIWRKINYTGIEENIYKEVAEQSDAVILGTGD